jgi:hypothetical protein
MITFKKIDTKIIGLDFSGEITGQDYLSVKPQIEKVMATEGRVKFLMDMTQLKNFTMSGIYQDVKFDVEHFKNVGDTAVVASKKTFEIMTKAVNMIYPGAKVYHFDDVKSAMNWLNGQAAAA